MQRAAAGLATTCGRLLGAGGGRVSGARVALLVGSGNNGGDALWAGARLARRGARVDAVLVGSRPHAEGLAALRRAGGRAVAAGSSTDQDALARARDVLRCADVVVDGLVGLGGSPGLRPPAAALVDAIGPSALVVAVDLPSGVDPDTGQTPASCVRAHVTVTFGAPKPCLLLPPASRSAGVLDVVDIGLGPLLDPADAAVERLEDADAAALLPVPDAVAHKYTRGVVGVVAGSAGYTGAAVLTCGGALRAGAGMVRYVGPEHPAERVRAAWPEVVVGTGRVQAWVLGSGVDLALADADQREALEAALACGLPCVLDAGALALVAQTRPAGPALLTPHAGELARLLTDLPGAGAEVSREDVEAAPLQAVRRAAAATGATVLLKGSVTLVAGPEGPVRSQDDATPWLATAGAGDVLAGIAGTYLAAGLSPLDAGSLAALVHGRAARAASRGGPLLAGDVASTVPDVVRALVGSTPR
jgi:hydroxyethylthiazole kinase-like uncharacterized protein yjeF